MDEGEAKRLFHFKHIFGGSAQGADPIIGKFFERRVGRNVIVRITLFRIVDVTTDRAFVFLHCALLRKKNHSLQDIFIVFLFERVLVFGLLARQKFKELIHCLILSGLPQIGVKLQRPFLHLHGYP